MYPNLDSKEIGVCVGSVTLKGYLGVPATCTFLLCPSLNNQNINKSTIPGH